MSKESLYSIVINLPREHSEYLREMTDKIGHRLDLKNKDEFHLTIEPTLYCADKSFRVNLSQWLELQRPFEITLDKIDCFQHRNGGLFYLTATDIEERSRVVDLHGGIHEAIKSRSKDRQNNSKYVPHVSLFSGVPEDKQEWLKYKLEKLYDPLVLQITEVSVRKKMDDYEWKDFGRFNLGSDDWEREVFLKYEPIILRA